MTEVGGGDAFISEFKHWRDVRGLSQSRLSKEMGYDRSYLSKIETGQERPTHDFATRAEATLKVSIRPWRGRSRWPSA